MAVQVRLARPQAVVAVQVCHIYQGPKVVAVQVRLARPQAVVAVQVCHIYIG